MNMNIMLLIRDVITFINKLTTFLYAATPGLHNYYNINIAIIITIDLINMSHDNDASPSRLPCRVKPNLPLVVKASTE